MVLYSIIASKKRRKWVYDHWKISFPSPRPPQILNGLKWSKNVKILFVSKYFLYFRGVWTDIKNNRRKPSFFYLEAKADSHLIFPVVDDENSEVNKDFIAFSFNLRAIEVRKKGLVAGQRK